MSRKGSIDELRKAAEAGAVFEKESGVPLKVEVLGDKSALETAYDAENAEHEMKTWEAVKKYPMACAWASLMCFTIVSLCGLRRFDCMSRSSC